MNSATTFGKGLSFPPRVTADGRVAWSVGEANVREAIRVILMTEPGERIMLPGFGAGLSRFLFEPNTPATRQLIRDQIGKALAQWEPRAALESVEVDPDPADPQAAVATITYRLIATQVRERVSLSVTLAG